MNIVFIGLSITSSWGNGHAVTYRGLVRELSLRGHDILFLERDVPWYAENRDLADPPWGRTALYASVEELRTLYAREVREAGAVIVGSYVPDGIEVGQWVTKTARGVAAFYDIDTPVTLAAVAAERCRYLNPELIRRYRLYLSFTGGKTLDLLMREYGSPLARALYCSADTEHYYPESRHPRWDLGYMGTYSDDRQPALDSLLCCPAVLWREGRFIVAGPQYPGDILWPENVERVEHLAPAGHRSFYGSQRFTLNITREAMVQAGYSPSIRLFEAAACGTAIISDWWEGIDTIFRPGEEILIARSPQESLTYLKEMTDEERTLVGKRGRERVLSAHTASHRAHELLGHLAEAA